MQNFDVQKNPAICIRLAGLCYLSFDFRILDYLLMRCIAQAEGWWSAVTVCHDISRL